MEEKNKRELSIDEMDKVSGGRKVLAGYIGNTYYITCGNCKSQDFETYSFTEEIPAYKFVWKYKCTNCGNIETITVFR